jgi:hypothetical protein
MRVNKELVGCMNPLFSTPDVYHKEERNQGKFPEDVEDNKIKGYKNS